jgi:hypothetical protein
VPAAYLAACKYMQTAEMQKGRRARGLQPYLADLIIRLNEAVILTLLLLLLIIIFILIVIFTTQVLCKATAKHSELMCCVLKTTTPQHR